MSIRKVSLGVGIGAVFGALCLLGQQVRLVGQERAVEVEGAPPVGTVDESNFYRATDVIGMAMKDDQGQVVGRVTDIVIDGTTEQVQYLIVEDVEMVADGHFLIVPWSVAEVHYVDVPDQRFVIVHVPRAQLLQAPTFARDGFSFRRGGDWFVQVNAFFDIDDRDSRRRSARPNLDKGRGRRGGDPSQTPDDRRRGAKDSTRPSPDARPSQDPQAQPERRQGASPRPKAEQPRPQQPQKPQQPAKPEQPQQQPENPEPSPQPSEQP